MLKDDYETLLRRGMLPHHELRYSGGAWCLIQGHIEESDARDLITMHAMRWYAALFDLGYMGLATMLELDQLLDRIIAGTKHLEPR